MPQSDQVLRLFDQVVDLPRDQWARFLDQKCADAWVRAEVERLVEAYDRLHTKPSNDHPVPQVSQSFGSREHHVFTDHEVVSGRFRIVRLLGRGGMGEVYQAEDLELGGLVALKTVLPEIARDDRSMERFRKEIQLAKKIIDWNVCRVFDIGHHRSAAEGEVTFLTMELLEGETLADHIRRKGKLTPVEALPVAEQMFTGLAAVHRAGIVHQDFKPGNIFLVGPKDGATRVVVTDFGLARSEGSTQSLTPWIQSLGIGGTPAYMAPEQLRGEKATVASDLYALGVVLYEMVTGTRPFPDEAPQMRLHESPISPQVRAPSLDSNWTKTILRCLERDPAARFSGASQVARALRGKTRALEQMRNWLHKHPWAWAAAGVAGLLAAIAMYLQHLPPEALEQTLLRLTTDTGVSAYPAISADGKLMAYASDRSEGGNLDIWLQQIGGEERVRVTNHEMDDYDPSLSPDGTKIAFRSERDGGGIYLIPALGGEARLIAAKGRGPRFSPDGTLIAYWVGAPGSALLPGSSKIYVVPASGGEAEVVHPEFVAAFSAIWSPDGKELLFLGRRDAKIDTEKSVDWWIAPVQGGTARRTGAVAEFNRRGLSPPEAQDWITPATWQAEGNRILFSATRADSTNIWELPLSARTGRLTGPILRRTSGTGVELQTAVTTGTTGRPALIYSSLTFNAAVWSLPIDETQGKAVGPLQRLTQGTSYVAFPSISSDGRKLAFSSFGAGKWTVKVRTLETGKEATIASDSLPLESRISGDATRVVYYVRGRKGDSDRRGDEMFFADTNGGGVIKLCGECGHPTGVSIDGKKILFEPVENTRNDVAMVEAASKHKISIVRPEIHPEYIMYDGNFSPDGRWIVARAALSRSTTDSKIFIIPIQAGRTPNETEWIAITAGHGFNGEACWSPDGHRLYFLSDRDGFRCIWAQELHPVTKRPLRDPTDVQHFHHFRRSLRQLTQGAAGLSVAGGRLFLAIGEVSGNIWLSEPFPRQ